MSQLHIEPLATKYEITSHLYPSFWHEIKDYVFYFAKVIVLVTVIYLFIRSSVVDRVAISGQSMYPNYNFVADQKDKILIDKLTPKFSGFFRGQVVVVISPDICIEQKELIIKRVIGLPGESVSFRDGYVYIVNAEYPQGQKLDEKDYLGPSVRTYKKITTPDSEVFDEKVLGKDEYYVMGDNRTGSNDSRRCGGIPKDQILGQEWFRLTPDGQKGFFKLPKYNINSVGR